MFVNFYGGDGEKHLIIRALCNNVANIIPLPFIIEIEFLNINENTWGGTHLNWKYKNKIVLNNILSLQEIPIVLIHELIHISQLHSGMLVVDRNNKVYWQGRHYEFVGLSYSEYQNLPWELDVSYRLKKILELSLKT